MGRARDGEISSLVAGAPVGAGYGGAPESEKPPVVTSQCVVTVSQLNFAMSEATLLHGVDAVFRPGRLVALMGMSGAGKTTMCVTTTY